MKIALTVSDSSVAVNAGGQVMTKTFLFDMPKDLEIYLKTIQIKENECKKNKWINLTTYSISIALESSDE